MTWCQTGPSHCLSQWWPSSLIHTYVTSPHYIILDNGPIQWVQMPWRQTICPQTCRFNFRISLTLCWCDDLVQIESALGMNKPVLNDKNGLEFLYKLVIFASNITLNKRWVINLFCAEFIGRRYICIFYHYHILIAQVIEILLNGRLGPISVFSRYHTYSQGISSHCSDLNIQEYSSISTRKF